MYRQRPPGPPRVKNEPAGGASFPALRRVDSSFPLGKGTDDLSPKAGSPRGSSPARAMRVRRCKFRLSPFLPVVTPLTSGPGPTGHWV
jgi:hypothetical protein